MKKGVFQTVFISNVWGALRHSEQETLQRAPKKNQRGPETPGDALRCRCHRWCVDGVRVCGGRRDPHPWDAFCGSGERGEKRKDD